MPAAIPTFAGAWCDMATYVIDLSDYLGQEMYIELHDEVITDGWANAFFDDVVTYYETAPDVSGRYDTVPDGHLPGEAARPAQIPWVLVPKASKEAAPQIPNGDFETGDLSGWTVYGSGFPIRNGLPAANSDETYWDQELPYNKSGSYFLNGWALSGNEASTWRVRSTPFALSGSGWISVKMGGHAAVVRVYRMDGTLVGEFDQTRFCDKEFPYIHNGGSWCDMATYLLDLTPNLGEVLYIELCDDPIIGGWANAFFDDVVTYYPSKPSAKTEWVTDGHQPGEKPQRAMIPTVEGINNLYTPRNGGFELGSLTGWTVLSKAFNAETAVVSAETYGMNDEAQQLPYNQVGNYHLSGRDVGLEEEDTWEIRSSPFTLAGTGYISIKMGGSSAAFRVRTVEDDKIIAYCRQRRFNDVNFPYISKGGSWWDMATYVMDLSPYLGQELVIELLDEKVDAGWAHAFFDDIVTYYPQPPMTYADTVTDGYNVGEQPRKVRIPWIYLDVYDEDWVGRFPQEPTALKDISCEMEPGDSLNLYDYFIKSQNLTDLDLEESSLTFYSVTYYDGYGNSSKISTKSCNNLQLEEGYYIIQYRFDRLEGIQRGTFDILVLPHIDKGFIPENAEIVNGGFETGDLTGWTPLTKGFNAGTAVISARTYFDQQMPYNQAGNYHLDGWKTGLTEESDTWSVQSSTFRLAGSGFISWRMGGNAAALGVFLVDGTEIAHVKQSRFKDNSVEYPNVYFGSWNDMGTYGNTAQSVRERRRCDIMEIWINK